MRELKPCPFCGSQEDVEFVGAEIKGRLIINPAIGCLKCNYKIIGEIVHMPCRERTIQISNNLLVNWWNRRANEKGNGK